jgi:hypothetical protein
MDKNEKTIELKKYRDLLTATLDYYLDNNLFGLKGPDFDPMVYLKSLKIQTEEHFVKGRLTMLKNWFRDMTEMPLETRDMKFNKYLQDKTGYDIDIFQSYFQRVDKIIAKGKITTDHQFYDLNQMVDQLCQTDPVDTDKIEILNKLLRDYETRKSRRKTTAEQRAK